jgi:hypothetical protein
MYCDNPRLDSCQTFPDVDTMLAIKWVGTKATKEGSKKAIDGCPRNNIFVLFFGYWRLNQPAVKDVSSLEDEEDCRNVYAKETQRSLLPCCRYYCIVVQKYFVIPSHHDQHNHHHHLPLSCIFFERLIGSKLWMFIGRSRARHLEWRVRRITAFRCVQLTIGMQRHNNIILTSSLCRRQHQYFEVSI